MNLLQTMDLEDYKQRIKHMAERTEELRILGVEPEGLRELYTWHLQEIETHAKIYGVDRQELFNDYLREVVR